MQYTLKEKKPLPKSEYLLVVEIPAEEVVHEQAHVLEHLKKDAEFPGFRKGFVPEKMIRERTGEMELWEEAASHALSHVLAKVFRADKLDVIGRPHVEVVKLSPANPAEFKVTLSLYPSLSLPDYKKISSEHNGKKPESADIEEKEIDTVVAEIKKQHEAATERERGSTEATRPNGATGKKDFSITDENVKEFGEFATVADFRAKVKEGLTSHKAERNREKRRAELLDKLTEKAKGDIPEVLILSELSRMEAELRSQIERMGGTWDAYQKEIKKDAAALHKDWHKDAERRARLQLVLVEIARTEKLNAAPEEVAKEVKHLLEHYKDADPRNAQSYVETLLTNQKVLEFLEGLK